MTFLIADASAIVDLLTDAEGGRSMVATLRRASEVHVPEHFHVEALSGLRGMARGGVITPVRAHRALLLLDEMRVVRHPVWPLRQAIWDLRDRLTAYDAAYLALAEHLDGLLLTADRGLTQAARAAGRLATLR